MSLVLAVMFWLVGHVRLEWTDAAEVGDVSSALCFVYVAD